MSRIHGRLRVRNHQEQTNVRLHGVDSKITIAARRVSSVHGDHTSPMTTDRQTMMFRIRSQEIAVLLLFSKLYSFGNSSEPSPKCLADELLLTYHRALIIIWSISVDMIASMQR
jgi:hypothetical protein